MWERKKEGVRESLNFRDLKPDPMQKGVKENGVRSSKRNILEIVKFWLHCFHVVNAENHISWREISVRRIRTVPVMVVGRVVIFIRIVQKLWKEFKKVHHKLIEGSLGIIRIKSTKLKVGHFKWQGKKSIRNQMFYQIYLL